jgi:tRNA pseudouridine(38-40) synthase
VQTTSHLDPFTRHFSHHLPSSVLADTTDWDTVAHALQTFEGEHNFLAFSTSSVDGDRDPMRTMTQCRLVRTEGGYRFEITGTGFLYKQVRYVIFTQLFVFWNNREGLSKRKKKNGRV